MGQNFFFVKIIRKKLLNSSVVWDSLKQLEEQVVRVWRESKKEEIYFIVNTTIHIRLGVYSTELFQDILQMWICIEKKRPMLLFSIKSN